VRVRMAPSSFLVMTWMEDASVMPGVREVQKLGAVLCVVPTTPLLQ
jgi:hypothetical protein